MQYSLQVLLVVVAVVASCAATTPTGTTWFNAACSCTAGKIPVAVDINLPVDPAHEPLNTTDQRNLHGKFGIFGIFCQPAARNTQQDHVQLLLHGSTYTSQYWTWPINGFQNYSYVAHACSQGHSTFAYDALGVGLSDRPVNSTDIQIPTSAFIASALAHQLKSGALTAALGLAPHRFRKVIAIGHSQGSVVFNYAAITHGSSAPFDALILTGHLHDPGFLQTSQDPRPAARDVDPARWGDLEPGYISNANRSQFYPPDPSMFSADLLQIDTLTKDVSTQWYTIQGPAVYVPAKGYSGPVVDLVGSEDQVHCLNAGDGNVPCNASVLQSSEALFWPDSRNFTMVVRQGQGHDVNLDFGAADTFRLFTDLVEQFAK